MPALQDVYEVRTTRGGAAISIGGTVVPKQEATLAAQIPGRVEMIAGLEGDYFPKGATLVALSTNELMAQRQAAIAQLANADAALRSAHVQYGREIISPQSTSINRMPGMGMPGLMDQFMTRPMASAMGLEQPGVQRGSDLYQQGTQLSQAQSALYQAQASIRQIDAKIRDSRSIAPFDGVITRKLVEIGDTVQPGQPLLMFADLTNLQVKVDVPARLRRSLRLGQGIPARLDVGGQVPVEVAQIFPVADPQRHTITVKFDLPGGAGASPGMYADVLIPDPDARGAQQPIVPKSALVWRGSLPGVLVLDENNRPELRLVRIGDEVPPDFVQVFSGLKPGERILRYPYGDVPSTER
jgi:multidrug efflux pump subunit AcrA (membrane-fusion protein)